MIDKRLRTGMAVAAAAVFAVALAAAPLLAEEKYEEKFAKTEALAKSGKLSLSNISGDIEIAVWKEAQVKIEALKTSKASSLEKAKENAAKVTIEVTKEGDLVRVETVYPKRTGGFWRGDDLRVSVDYKVWVPDQAAVELKSVSGDVDVAALGGMARIECVSGDIGLAGAAGAEIKLTSGDLVLKNVGGDVFIKAVSGDIGVTGVKGSVQADAVSGDIELRDIAGARTVDVKTVSGNVTYVGAIEAGGRYELKTHSGDVRMTVPADAGFEFDASTFNGSIETDFEIKVVGKISPREVRATIGKGGATVTMKSFSGDVELMKKK